MHFGKCLSRPLGGLRAPNAFILGGIVEGFPQIESPLNIEPEFSNIAKHASQNESYSGGKTAFVVAQFVHMLALHAYSLGLWVP
jgi:hypothetical protein